MLQTDTFMYHSKAKEAETEENGFSITPPEMLGRRKDNKAVG